MNRLRDESAADAMVGRGIDLLRSTPGTPSMPKARRRVWAAIEDEVGRARRGETRRLSPLRLFALIAALVLIGGTAGAVIGGGGLGPLLERLAGRTRPASGVGDVQGYTARPALHRIARRDATPRPTAPAAGERELSAPVIGTPPGTQRRHTRVSGARGADTAIAPSPPVRGDGEVLDAMVALRQHRDAARAADILARYLADHPRGALREEALVLSIEAAAVRGDQPDVERLAKQYLASYPSGRFSPYVEEKSKRR
jgi:hypothetical protein